ncbi:MAG: alpha/beta fold hydrolase [Candidatus Nanohaloarchaea archaeon]
MLEAGDLSYRTEEGEGTPIVFVHGWLCTKDTWRKVEEELELNNPLVFYDQRCHGDSSCSEFDFGDLAEDLKNLVEKLGIEEPVLVGDSMGGMVSLKYAVEYDNFSGLFLTGTSASTPEPENYSPRFFLEKFGSMDRRAWALEIVENYAADTELEDAKDAARRTLIEAGDTEVIYSLGSMMSYDVRDQLKELNVEAEVVAGTRDGAITMEKSRELADLLDCRLREIDATHLMLQEQPGEIADLLEDFVSSTTS